MWSATCVLLGVVAGAGARVVKTEQAWAPPRGQLLRSRTGPPAVAEPARAGQPEMSKLDRREALRAAQVAVVRRPASSRTSVPIMGMSEADAKAAWLAQTSAGYIRRDAHVPEGQPYNSWLAPSAPMLTLEAADEMSNVALREAIARGFKPVCVCVVDAAGIPLVTKRMPGSMGLSPEFAMAKASTCIGMQCSSRDLGAKYINEQGIGPKMPQTLAMELCGAANGKAIVHFPGGVMLRDGAGNLVGAIAVSGASSDEDEHCAILAAHSVGLVTEPAASRLL